MYYIYFLFSETADKYYVGQSQNPWQRLIQHLNYAGERFTGRYNDWNLIAVFEVSNSKRISKYIMKVRVVVFSRVSTLAQNYQRQTDELLEYAAKMGYSVERIFEEKISGAKKNKERKELMAMMSYIKSNQIKKVITWELSRMGRNAAQVLQVKEMLNEAKVNLYIKNYMLETLNPDGTVNPLSQFMVQILNSVNEMERQTKVQRLRSGYSATRRKGT